MTGSLSARLAVVSALLLVPSLTLAQPQFEVLHAFEGLPGNATAPLLVGPDGKLYGVTSRGGPDGAGTVFRAEPGLLGAAETLHAFNGIDGRTPVAGLILGIDGALYGTTTEGGAARLGTIFKVTLDGDFTLLHTFRGSDGARPLASLVQAADGTFYGTTSTGGPGRGVVFAMSPTGSVTTLHSFRFPDGEEPFTPVVLATDGHLYGLTAGPPFFGPTIYRLTRDGDFTVLHQFPPFTIGVMGLIQASDGNLYGAVRSYSGPLQFFRITPSGVYTPVYTVLFPGLQGDMTWSPGRLVETEPGVFHGTLPLGGLAGHGTAFRLTASGAFTVLYTFSPSNGRAYSGLVEGPGGLLFGVTFDGGIVNHGQVFSLTPSGSFAFVAGFAGAAGDGPWAVPIRGPDGALYGTTVAGGIFNRGTVYRLAPDGTLTTLHMFHLLSGNGQNPVAGLVLASDGFLYGTTVGGGCGPSSGGVVFRISTSGAFTRMHCFTAGEQPYAPLIQASDGRLYGTTATGGANGTGTAFRLSLTGDFEAFHSFDLVSSFPLAPLVEGDDGNFYGTTAGPPSGPIGGSVFKLTPDGQRTTLRVFSAILSIGLPPRLLGGLTKTEEGNFLGATTATDGDFEFGELFQITPAGTYSVLSFSSGVTFSPPARGADGHYYGTDVSFSGNVPGFTTIYRLTLAGQRTQMKAMIHETDGSLPAGPLVLQPDGSFIGAAFTNGPKGRGTIFRFTPPPLALDR